MLYIIVKDQEDYIKVVETYEEAEDFINECYDRDRETDCFYQGRYQLITADVKSKINYLY